MIRKIFKTGNSTVISLPKEYLDALDIGQGQEVSVELDRENHQLVIRPSEQPLASVGIDAEFATLVAEFIEKYKPALDELAKS